MEAFYIGAFLVFLLAGIAVNTSGRVNVTAEWIIFLFGFFAAMAFGIPVMDWIAVHVHQVVQQPPGKLGGGS